MADDKSSGPKVPIERPDKQAAARDPTGNARDRPGFDLGGATKRENKDRSELPPQGPGASPGRAGDDASVGRSPTSRKGSR